MNGKRRRCQLCVLPSRRFSGKVSIAYHRPLPLTRAYFSLRSATEFIYWEGRKKSTLTTLTGQLSVGHSRVPEPSLCEAFSVQACILPADPKALIPFLHSFRASQHPEFVDKEMNWFIWWASERFINLLWDTQQSKRWGNWPWILEVTSKAECKGTIWNIATGVTSSPRTTGCGHD